VITGTGIDCENCQCFAGNGSDRAKSPRLLKSEAIAWNDETFCPGPHARACRSIGATMLCFTAVVPSFAANFVYASQLNLSTDLFEQTRSAITGRFTYHDIEDRWHNACAEAL
jgi:hypothetical protein